MKSIRFQLTVSLLGAVTVIFLGGFAVVYLLLREELHEQMDVRLRNAAHAVSAEIKEAIEESGYGTLHKEFEELENEGIVPHYFEIREDSGDLVGRSKSLGNEGLYTFDLSGKSESRSQELSNGIKIRSFFLRFDDGTRSMVIGVAENQQEVDEALHQALGIIVFTAALVLLTTFSLVPWILRRGLISLDQLASHMTQVDVTTLDAQFTTEEYPEELRPVMSRFNALLSRLNDSFERERRVNADLAHELRTPLAELRLITESALKWPHSRDITTDDETLAIAQQMEALVERMLMLARSERGLIQTVKESFDLDLLIRQVWRTFAAKAESRQISVTLDLSAGDVESDPILLRSILTNLFDNATSYAPPGGLIVICSGSNTPSGFFVRISNTAPDLTPRDLNHFFERYWRKGTARSDTGDHAGLGLAIVDNFVRTLNGKIGAALSETGILSITFRLPAQTNLKNNAEEKTNTLR